MASLAEIRKAAAAKKTSTTPAKPTATAKPAAAAPAAPARKAGRKSRYADVKASAPRDPMLNVGKYRLRVVSCEEGSNPGTGAESFKSHVEIVEIFDGGEGHSVGDVCFLCQSISGKGAQAGLGRVKAYAMAAAGFEEAEFDEMDPDGKFIDACVGDDNEFSDQTITGRLVDVQVMRGRDRDDGDWYREYAWGIVPDDEQDAA